MKGQSVVGLATAAVAIVIGVTGCGGGQAKGAKGVRAAGRSTAHGTASGLPEATTFTSLHGVVTDGTATPDSDGTGVVHPTTAVPVSASPGGPEVATLPATELGNPTWVPVVATSQGWDEVLLPSRPNHSAGWIRGEGLQTAHSPYSISVKLGQRKLTLTDAGKQIGSWPVAVGDAKTPTPTGRTFVLAQLAPSNPNPSPLILPLGTHSPTLDSFGGGPGTVAFHGWPDAGVFGKAVTHGCVRVPSDALRALAKVPLGTPVVVSA